MKILKRSATMALLLFVGVTVGVLIAQEVSHTAADPIEGDPNRNAAEATEAVASVETSDPSAPSDVIELPALEAEDAAASDARDIESGTPPTAIAAPDAERPCVVDAIYFHNTLRCRTCKNIEETAKAVLEAEFAEEFAVGRMRWSAVNMESQRHYVEEYDLVKPTLILVRSVGDEQTDWVALDETWTLIRSELRFADYVENETRGFLEACP